MIEAGSFLYELYIYLSMDEEFPSILFVNTSLRSYCAVTFNEPIKDEACHSQLDLASLLPPQMTRNEWFRASV